MRMYSKSTARAPSPHCLHRSTVRSNFCRHFHNIVELYLNLRPENLPLFNPTVASCHGVLLGLVGSTFHRLNSIFSLIGDSRPAQSVDSAPISHTFRPLIIHLFLALQTWHSADSASLLLSFSQSPWQGQGQAHEHERPVFQRAAWKNIKGACLPSSSDSTLSPSQPDRPKCRILSFSRSNCN